MKILFFNDYFPYICQDKLLDNKECIKSTCRNAFKLYFIVIQ